MNKDWYGFAKAGMDRYKGSPLIQTANRFANGY